jgi:hypothetical protein
MKIFRRNLLLASSALALVMLLGCSSTGETSDSGGSSGGGSACENACYGDNVPDFQLDECLASCGIAD